MLTVLSKLFLKVSQILRASRCLISEIQGSQFFRPKMNFINARRCFLRFFEKLADRKSALKEFILVCKQKHYTSLDYIATNCKLCIFAFKSVHYRKMVRVNLSPYTS